MSYVPPVRRCAPCDRDWPNDKVYNLCPRCQRNTSASTSVDGESPNREHAKRDAARYNEIRAFDARADEAAAQRRAQWDADMELLLERTPAIPDPSGAAGLPPLNPQDVDAWDRQHLPPTWGGPPLPSEGEIEGWADGA